MYLYFFRTNGFYKNDDIIKFLNLSEKEYIKKLKKYNAINFIWNYYYLLDKVKIEKIKVFLKLFNIEIITKKMELIFIYKNKKYDNLKEFINLMPLEQILNLEQEISKCVKYVTYYDYCYFRNEKDINNFIKELNIKNYKIYKYVVKDL